MPFVLTKRMCFTWMKAKCFKDEHWEITSWLLDPASMTTLCLLFGKQADLSFLCTYLSTYIGLKNPSGGSLSGLWITSFLLQQITTIWYSKSHFKFRKKILDKQQLLFCVVNDGSETFLRINIPEKLLNILLILQVMVKRIMGKSIFEHS